MGCGCRNNKVSTTDCSSLVVEDFQTYLNVYICIRDSGRYGEISMSLDYVQTKITELLAAMADKRSNSKSCTYQSLMNGYVVDYNLILGIITCE